jgi:hypothetical protein
MKRLDSEKYLSRELYIEREDFLEIATTKVLDWE